MDTATEARAAAAEVAAKVLLSSGSATAKMRVRDGESAARQVQDLPAQQARPAVDEALQARVLALALHSDASTLLQAAVRGWSARRNLVETLKAFRAEKSPWHRCHMCHGSTLPLPPRGMRACGCNEMVAARWRRGAAAVDVS